MDLYLIDKLGKYDNLLTNNCVIIVGGPPPYPFLSFFWGGGGSHTTLRARKFPHTHFSGKSTMRDKPLYRNTLNEN